MLEWNFEMFIKNELFHACEKTTLFYTMSHVDMEHVDIHNCNYALAPKTMNVSFIN